MKHFYLATLLLCGTVGASAQGLPGYVITPAGDTLRGIVAEKSPQRIGLYRPNAPIALYRPEQLRGYGVGRQAAYLSRIVHLSTGADSVRFVHPVLQGRASLYTSGTDALLQPAGQQELYELTPLNWHLLFHRYLSGCPNLAVSTPEALQKPFSKEEVERQIILYNSCGPTGQSLTFTEDHSQGWLARYGFWGGTTLTSMKLNDNFRDYLPSRTKPGSGYVLGLEAMAVRANGLFLGGQVVFSQHQTETAPYTYSLYATPAPQTFTETLAFRYLQTSIRGSIGSSFGPPRLVTPFGSVGLAMTSTYQTKEIITQTSSPTGPQTLEKDLENGGNFYLEGNLGIWIRSSATTSVRLSLQYGWGYLTNHTFNAGSTQVLMGQVGYFFLSH
ncbi:hypothetical protein [Hymenobacter metallicola]|uniref:PorT family protein n=1 Tax=Hymenobacter metallicola TaxID=2563114 RepID=A0A4Z0QDB8_9BACT|nr:hypothetical protein [Hymenobacter metallicola]TGE28047.1 hypothetical protein E5K02_00860 [Hymenobacter metallicola]